MKDFILIYKEPYHNWNQRYFESITHLSNFINYMKIKEYFIYIKKEKSDAYYSKIYKRLKYLEYENKKLREVIEFNDFI